MCAAKYVNQKVEDAQGWIDPSAVSHTHTHTHTHFLLVKCALRIQL